MAAMIQDETRVMNAAEAAAPEPFRLAVVQMDVAFAEVDANLDRILEFARGAAAKDARLVVFPECALTGYCFESEEEALAVSQSIPGPATQRIHECCRELNLHIVFGLIERDGDRIFNCVALVGPNGPISSYRKVHLPFLGLDRFVSGGNRPFRVHETALCRLGLNICYDGGFPESARVLALQGADLILLPTNWPSGAEEFARYAINTRAMENVVYYAAANRVGEERGFQFIGKSRICDVHGRTLAEADETTETVLYAEIRPGDSRVKRIVRVPGKHIIDRIDDRRPEFYGRILEK